MEGYFLWRLSLLLVALLAFSLFVALYTLANKALHGKQARPVTPHGAGLK